MPGRLFRKIVAFKKVEKNSEVAFRTARKNNEVTFRKTGKQKWLLGKLEEKQLLKKLGRIAKWLLEKPGSTVTFLCLMYRKFHMGISSE